jgi:hypothetical protein
MSIQNSENSFFSLCNLDKLFYNNNILEHNLLPWKIHISDYKIKGTTWHVSIVLPYKEMSIELKEMNEDVMFFDKHICRLYLKNTLSDEKVWLNKTIVLKFSTDVKYLLFVTPYFYPHNIYYYSNHLYLFEKILHSINYLNNFQESYNKVFNGGVPLMFIKSTLETKTEYILEIIITLCINIIYTTSDVNTNTIYCTLLINNEKKSNDTGSKYHNIELKIPRTIDIKTGNVNFNFFINYLNK